MRLDATALAIAVLALGGCSGEGGFTLSVDVRTDLNPGVDFVRVETLDAAEPIATVSTPEMVRFTDFAGADFVAGERVAELDGLPRGTRYVEVRLVDSVGGTVLSRTTLLELTSNYAVTLVLSSACTGVVCPSASDPASATACQGGACVDPRCTPEDPTHCGEPQCTTNTECAASGCRAGICGDGVCLLSPDDSLCGDGESCQPDGSCITTAVDSGAPDTGAPDAVVDSGVPSTTGSFCPDAPLLRQQLAAFLVRYMHGVDFRSPAATGVFTDVPTSSPYAADIEQLARDGITMGCGTDIFCPTDPVLRDQAATFLVRARYGPSFRPPAATGVFTDVPLSNVHAANIEQIYRDGITLGCGTNLYCPSDPLLRRHFAVFLVRLIYGPSYVPPAPIGLFSDVDPTDSQAPYIEKLAFDGFTRGC